MRFLSKFVLATIISISANAQDMWGHPQNTESDFYRDSTECETYARQSEQYAENGDAQMGRLIGDATVNTNANPNLQNSYRNQQQAQSQLIGKLIRAFTNNTRKNYDECMMSLGYIRQQ